MTLKPLDLKNEIAVVTGGANGIGKGIVKALLEQEMKVVIADIEQSVLDATVEEFSSFGEVSGFVTDVSDPVSVESLADHVFSTFGSAPYCLITQVLVRGVVAKHGIMNQMIGNGVLV